MTDEIPVCDAGRALTRADHHVGLDWATPCQHPVEHTIWLTDEQWFLSLCPCHFQALEGEGLLFTTVVGGLDCQPGDSNYWGPAPLD